MKLAVVLWSLLVFAQAGAAQVQLPAFFSDHAVLQRDAPLHIWGWARPGARITAKFHRQSGSAISDTSGEWSLWLEPEHAGGPFQLELSGDGNLERTDLLVGDVWIASGQSNMEMPLRGFLGAPMKNSAAEIEAATHPKMRLMHVGHVSSDFPLADVDGHWTQCTPETAAAITAVGYFFGREISDKENVPIGIIDATWGGTPADSWISMDTLSADTALQAAFASRALFANSEARRDRISRMEAKQDELDKAQGLPPARHAWRPSQRGWIPSNLYNGMIAPITGLSIKGVIWYQGETNSRPDRYRNYAPLFPALIQDWRAHFQQGDFPFLFVQISSFISPEEHWGVIRDAQRRALAVRNTAMAVTIDVGDPNNVHPADKQTVGHRLALAARGMVYGESIAYRSPSFVRATFSDGAATVWLQDAEGLMFRGAAKGFEVAGADRKFAPAEATISAGRITLRAKQISDPQFVRYAWTNEDAGSVYNAAGLPLGTFTSESSPQE